MQTKLGAFHPSQTRLDEQTSDILTILRYVSRIQRYQITGVVLNEAN